MKGLLFFVGIFCLFFGSISYAHPMLPPEAIEFVEMNPNATKEEFDAFLIKTYGDGILEEIYGLPLEAIEFVEENPNVSREELDAFLVKTYGEKVLEEIYVPPEDDIESNISGKDQRFGGKSIETPLSKKIQKIREDTTLLLSVADERKPFLENAKDFTILGIEHILIGLDHILFVISLVLVLVPWKKIFFMITTFTIAHSLTLMISGSQILTLSSKVVEPIIAFSIAYMAITSVFLRRASSSQKQFHNTIGIIFLFGLFHGLGFAGVFSELSIPTEKYLSSLFFFNVGVEIGQMLILLIVVPILVLLSKNKKIYTGSISIIAGGISALALFWGIERLFF
jgi:hydrogenase/urease accessory protein HupE